MAGRSEITFSKPPRKILPHSSLPPELWGSFLLPSIRHQNGQPQKRGWPFLFIRVCENDRLWASDDPQLSITQLVVRSILHNKIRPDSTNILIPAEPQQELRNRQPIGRTRLQKSLIGPLLRDFHYLARLLAPRTSQRQPPPSGLPPRFFKSVCLK